MNIFLNDILYYPLFLNNCNIIDNSKYRERGPTTSLSLNRSAAWLDLRRLRIPISNNLTSPVAPDIRMAHRVLEVQENQGDHRIFFTMENQVQGDQRKTKDNFGKHQGIQGLPIF